jgi:hypothetical protein
MPLYTFHVHTSEGQSEMELGFYRDEAAFAYAEQMGRSAEVQVWRSSEHLKTVGKVVELEAA